MARYTDEFRASAVVMLLAAGWPETKGALSKVSRHIKVPHPTLSRWARLKQNPPPNKAVQEKREDMAVVLERLMYKLANEMDAAIPDAPLNHLATTYGITFDKHRLLSGQSTENANVNIRIGYDADD